MARAVLNECASQRSQLLHLNTTTSVAALRYCLNVLGRVPRPQAGDVRAADDAGSAPLTSGRLMGLLYRGGSEPDVTRTRTLYAKIGAPHCPNCVRRPWCPLYPCLCPLFVAEGSMRTVRFRPICTDHPLNRADSSIHNELPKSAARHPSSVPSQTGKKRCAGARRR